MDPDRISDEGAQTQDVFRRLTRWLQVPSAGPDRATAIPDRSPGDGEWGRALEDVRWDVPDDAHAADWTSSMRAMFDESAASPGPDDAGRSGSSGRGSKSEQGA